MTTLLEKAVDMVRALPADAQDEIARAMLMLAGAGDEVEETDPAHLASILEGLAQARRREFATQSQTEAAFRRFDE